MEIKKVNKAEIIIAGREAMSKVKSHNLDVLDNITLTLAVIIGVGLKTGYRVKMPFYEFSDFSELITKVTKAESCIAQPKHACNINKQDKLYRKIKHLNRR